MAMRKTYTLADLKSLTRAQLEVVCHNRSIDIDSMMTKEGIISMILEEQFNLKTNAEKPPENDPPEPKSTPEPAPVSHPDEGKPATNEPMPALEATNGNDRVWFRVMAGSQEHEKNDVFAALNGEAILIKRNHWVKLKSKFLKIFEDAVQTEVYLEDDEAKIRNVPRFNYMTRSLEEGLPKSDRRRA